MRPLIAITQRVKTVEGVNEVRECLDIQWVRFLDACGAEMVPLPTYCSHVEEWLDRLDVSGIILSGGNSHASLGTNDGCSDRDALEETLIQLARSKGIPLLGVCRGMQVIGHHYGARLVPVKGHVALRHSLELVGNEELVDVDDTSVNSFHDFGIAAKDMPLSLKELARSSDGIVEALVSDGGECKGIMWHPEREDPFKAADIKLFQSFFKL